MEVQDDVVRPPASHTAVKKAAVSRSASSGPDNGLVFRRSTKFTPLPPLPIVGAFPFAGARVGL